MEEAQKTSFPRITLGNTAVANSLLGNSQKFSHFQGVPLEIDFFHEKPLEIGRLEIVSHLAPV
jgi:hypothetical protein